MGQAGRVDRLNQPRVGSEPSGPQPDVAELAVPGQGYQVRSRPRRTRGSAVRVPDLQLALAKLTLSLRITGVRADGYHLLDADMVTIDLADEAEMVRARETACRWFEAQSPDPETRSPVGTGPDNLVRRALDLIGRTASVRLVKRIPAGAGLGGGSADAAAVLRWAGRQGDVDRARQLGADVAFCARGGRARVRGVGDILEPLPFEAGIPTRLLTPPVPVCDGCRVHRMWDALGGPTGCWSETTLKLPPWPWSRGWRRLERPAGWEATGLVPTPRGQRSRRGGSRGRSRTWEARLSCARPNRAEPEPPPAEAAEAATCRRVVASGWPSASSCASSSASACDAS